MDSPEKNTEKPLQTIIRTATTTTVIALILTFAHVFPQFGMGKFTLFGTIWLMVLCIVYGGHLFELVFINHIKFVLPHNRLVLYFTRIVFWFLSSIPLFALANWVGNSLTNHGLHLGKWWVFGLLYIGIELFMHAIMHLRWKKSFYNGVY
jgi:hypothetical protein